MKSTDKLPEGYSAAYAVDLQKDKKLMLLVNAIGLIIAAIMIVVAFLIDIPFTLFDMSEGLLSYVLRFLVLIAGMAAYMVLHELVHGITMKLYGAKKINYGFTIMYAYAGSDWYFGKVPYIIIALAPVVMWGVVLGVICPLVDGDWFWIAYIIQIMNLSGAGGDIYVTCKFIREPKDILIKDTGVAMTVYKRAE